MDTAITIHHRDTIYAAYKICLSRQIWSQDGYQQANFHENELGGGSICGDEVTLSFQWAGPVEQSPRKWPGRPNILYRVPWLGNANSLWSLILFPGTNTGLKLVGISHVSISADQELEHKQFLVSEMAKLVVGCPQVIVPTADQKLICTCAQLPPQSFWNWMKRAWSRRFSFGGNM